jgi:aminomethyltransferase
MGRLVFHGPNAPRFLDTVTTRRVADIEPNQVRYSLVCKEDGGILDDVLVYSSDGEDRPIYSMVVNASNREKIFRWIKDHLLSWQQMHSASEALRCFDETEAYAMFAVQGPKALQVLQPLFGPQLNNLRYYQFGRDQGMLISRTGYTGEDGFEIICQADRGAVQIWNYLIESASEAGGMAAGLGARDTLRLEAAMPLYGHELTEEINPLEAGLDFAVNLKDRRFPGSDVLAAVKRDGPKRVRVGLELAGKRVPREHYGIFAEGRAVGEVTSGTFSPTLQKPIAMGYVPPQYASVGTELQIDIRGARESARVVKLPFYKRSA